MTTTTPANTRSPRRTRRRAGAAAMALAAATVTAGTTAPTSAAATVGTYMAHGTKVDCIIYHDVRIGPVVAGTTDGNCRTATGEYTPGAGTYPGAWFIGSVAAPDGNVYSGLVLNQWNLPVH
jgi:hypothetical protein